MTTRLVLDTDRGPHLRERTIDGERLLEALTEEGFAAGLDASLATGISIVASAELGERFGLADHGDDSAELLDFLPPGARLDS